MTDTEETVDRIAQVLHEQERKRFLNREYGAMFGFPSWKYATDEQREQRQADARALIASGLLARDVEQPSHRKAVIDLIRQRKIELENTRTCIELALACIDDGQGMDAVRAALLSAPGLTKHPGGNSTMNDSTQATETTVSTECTRKDDCPAELHAKDCVLLRETLEREAYDESEWHAHNPYDY